MREDVPDTFTEWMNICHEAEVIVKGKTLREEELESSFRTDSRAWCEKGRKSERVNKEQWDLSQSNGTWCSRWPWKTGGRRKFLTCPGSPQATSFIEPSWNMKQKKVTDFKNSEFKTRSVHVWEGIAWNWQRDRKVEVRWFDGLTFLYQSTMVFFCELWVLSWECAVCTEWLVWLVERTGWPSRRLLPLSLSLSPSLSSSSLISIFTEVSPLFVFLARLVRSLVVRWWWWSCVFMMFLFSRVLVLTFSHMLVLFLRQCYILRTRWKRRHQLQHLHSWPN